MIEHNGQPNVEQLLERALLITDSQFDRRMLADIYEAVALREVTPNIRTACEPWASGGNSKRRRSGGVLVVIASIILLLTAIAFGLTSWSHQNLALGQVLTALSEVKTIQFELTTVMNNKKEGTRIVVQEHAMVLEPDRYRYDSKDGRSIRITDRRTQRHLQLLPHEKIAYLTQDFPSVERIAHEDRWRSWLRWVSPAEATRVGTVKLDGRKAVEFLVQEGSSKMRFWVDAQTRLPLRIETVSPLPPAVGRGTVEKVYSNFKFDQTLDASLFATTPPSGYAVKPMMIRELAADEELRDKRTNTGRDWTVSPESGLGPVEFGASKQEILDLLGDPGTVVAGSILRLVGIGAPGEQIDSQYNPGPGEMVAKYEELPVEVLSYGRDGVKLSVSPVHGLIAIDCIGQNVQGRSTLDFAGQTERGVRLGDSAEQVRSRYGKPDEELGQTSPSLWLGYQSKGYKFGFENDRLVWIHVRKPGRAGWGMLPGDL